MIYNIDVLIREDLVDAYGDGLLKDIEDLGIKGAKSARIVKTTEIEGDFDKNKLSMIGRDLLSDPVSQKFVIGSVKGKVIKDSWLIKVNYKPGVTDSVAETTMKGLLDMGIKKAKSVNTSTKVILRGNLSEKKVDLICRKLLANPVIQTYSFEKK